ncbi:MAG TPA: amidohydrolase family protein [Chloroflexota bacterium]|nr:amidohydrolase family protein [Chloroflexota bacterium]
MVDAKSEQRLMNFNLGLRKERGGQWRIATESTSGSKPPLQPVTAEKLIADMDKAGIRRALVLSTGYYLGGAGSDNTPRLKPVNDKVKAVQLENDWQAAQVARYPDRLVLACGINPMESYAIAEMVRCKQSLQARAVKMKVGEHGDKLDLNKPDDRAKLRRFFKAANDNRMAIVIHLGSDGGLGRKEVRSFLNDVVSAAPDIPIQIAHMGFASAQALSEFADARAAGDPLTKNLYFDLSVGSFKDLPTATGSFLAEAIRKIGLEHVLYASDTLPGDHNPPTHEHWPAMRSKLPLTEAEFRAIADNITPYIR